MIKGSKICPEEDEVGLFVISNPVLTGTLFEVTMDIVTFPRQSGESWQSWTKKRDARLDAASYSGHYNFHLWDATE